MVAVHGVERWMMIFDVYVCAHIESQLSSSADVFSVLLRLKSYFRHIFALFTRLDFYFILNHNADRVIVKYFSIMQI